MNKYLLAALAIIIIASVAALLILAQNTALHNSGNISGFTFANTSYKFTYVATTPQEWQKGLMNYSVTNTTFELFVFPKVSIYPFWMYDTYYPLDIIWINGSRVTYVAHAIPCSWYSPGQTDCMVYNNYTSAHYANYVIEAHGGFANSTGLRTGSIVSIS